MRERMTVRPGGPDDSGVLVDLFDDAVGWLVARGQPEQWGNEPFSQRPEGRERVAELVASGYSRGAVMPATDSGYG